MFFGVCEADDCADTSASTWEPQFSQGMMALVGDGEQKRAVNFHDAGAMYPPFHTSTCLLDLRSWKSTSDLKWSRVFGSLLSRLGAPRPT